MFQIRFVVDDTALGPVLRALKKVFPGTPEIIDLEEQARATAKTAAPAAPGSGGGGYAPGTDAERALNRVSPQFSLQEYGAALRMIGGSQGSASYHLQKLRQAKRVTNVEKGLWRKTAKALSAAVGPKAQPHKPAQKAGRGLSDRVLANLPDTFTREQFINASEREGGARSAASSLLHHLHIANKVAKGAEVGQWRKTAASRAAAEAIPAQMSESTQPAPTEPAGPHYSQH